MTAETRELRRAHTDAMIDAGALVATYERVGTRLKVDEGGEVRRVPVLRRELARDEGYVALKPWAAVHRPGEAVAWRRRKKRQAAPARRRKRGSR